MATRPNTALDPLADKLRQVHTIAQLMQYLHEELGWPVDVDDWEVNLFDWQPEEINLKAEHVVKVKSIKQLRPLVSGQPWGIFSLDRLARTLHLLNALVAGHTLPLFLNVHGRLLAAVGDDHGRAFRRVVDALGVSPASIVIETPVEASAQPDLLTFVLRNYRANGFRVAVNLDSLAQWQAISSHAWPDFVKIDSRKLGSGSPAREALEWLTALRGDATPILTHVEDASPDYRSLAAGNPLWLQGYAYGLPEAGEVARPAPVATAD